MRATFSSSSIFMLGLLSAGLGAFGPACSNLPAVEPPPPIVQPAPAEVAHLAIYVFQLVQPPATPEDNWDYHHTPGYTSQLRRLFLAQLQQAGFTVILERATPADLVATVQSDMPHDKPGVATLVLSRQGVIVDRISVPVQVSGKPPRTVHHAEESAVRLVEALSKSAAVAAVAREVLAQRTVQAPESALTIASAACPAPDEQLPEEPKPPLVECVIERKVRCQPPSPVRSAWQPTPFVQCPRDVPAFDSDVLQLPAKFSSLETRARRLGGACGATPGSGECCYVQFTARVCR